MEMRDRPLLALYATAVRFFRQHPVLRACGNPSRRAMNLHRRLLPSLGNQHVESPMTMTTERRNFLKAVSAAAASTAVLAGTQALAQGNLQAAAKAMPYQAKPMPFDPKTITGISEKVLVSHYENNYVGAVKRLNAIDTQLAELDFAKAPNFVINGLKREELVGSNSMILHEIYFDGLGGGARASGPLADAIARDFGSMERWRSEFVAIGGRRWFGLGDPRVLTSRQADVNQWAADHTTTLAGGSPVL